MTVPSVKEDEEGDGCPVPGGKGELAVVTAPSTVPTVTHGACPRGCVLTRHSAVMPFPENEAEATAAGLSLNVAEGQQWGAPFLGSMGYGSPATQPGLGGHPEEMQTGPGGLREDSPSDSQDPFPRAGPVSGPCRQS